MNWKRCIAVILIAMLMACAAYADEVSVMNMTLEDLLSLNKQIGQELEAYSTEREFPEGMWVVGKDMPAGTYKIEAAESSDQAYVTQYTSEDVYVSGTALSIIPEWGNRKVWLNLQDGDKLQVEWGAVSLQPQEAFLTLGNAATVTGMYDIFGMEYDELWALNHRIIERLRGMQNFGYIEVSVGEWTIGEDIPVGSYNLLACAAPQAYIEIYEGDKWLTSYCISDVRGYGEQPKQVEMKEGYVVKVYWASIAFADANTNYILYTEDTSLLDVLQIEEEPLPDLNDLPTGWVLEEAAEGEESAEDNVPEELKEVAEGKTGEDVNIAEKQKKAVNPEE